VQEGEVSLLRLEGRNVFIDEKFIANKTKASRGDTWLMGCMNHLFGKV